MITGERADEVRTLLAALNDWAQGRPDVVAVGVVGSWARGDARMDSDVDVMALTKDRAPYLEDEAWVSEVGGVGPVRTRRWGVATERRFALPSGLEVELGLAHPSWASTDPMDGGTRGVVTDGMSVIYDPEGLLASLLDACGRSETTGVSDGLGNGHA
jgi:uncharacterized protein